MNNVNKMMLTGGLGNQLFQLACGLAVSRGPLEIDLVHGHPRLSVSGNPDLLDFVLPHGVTFSHQPYSKLISRILGYNLRLGIIPQGIERQGPYRFFVSLISSFLFSLYFKEVLIVRSAKGVGFDATIKAKTQRRIMVGYFQSYKWLSTEDLKIKLLDLRLKNPSKKFNDYLDEICTEPTIVLHLRLGDYLNEPAFGTPNPEYFAAGLERLATELGKIRVWGFSDQPKLASSILDSLRDFNITWVEDRGLSSSETLELMRHGAGFIMANSTFSWWAAMLRHNQSAPVISPLPWFKAMEEPQQLIPPEWIRLKAYYDL